MPGIPKAGDGRAAKSPSNDGKYARHSTIQSEVLADPASGAPLPLYRGKRRTATATQSKAAALALGTLPLMHLGPWPGFGRIWKLVTAWNGVVEPSFWARVMTRR